MEKDSHKQKNFFTILNFTNALKKHEVELGNLLKHVAEETLITPQDIEISCSPEDLKKMTIFELVEHGTPLYHAIVAKNYPDSASAFKKIEHKKDFSLKRFALTFFCDIAMIWIQGKSIHYANNQMPSILKSIYKFDYNEQEIKRYLYGSNNSIFPETLLFKLTSHLKFGKIGTRMGLGMAGMRLPNALTKIWFKSLPSNKEIEVIALIRMLSKLPPNDILHPLNRSIEFTQTFGSLNNTISFLINEFGDPESIRRAKRMKFISALLNLSTKQGDYDKLNFNKMMSFLMPNVNVGTEKYKMHEDLFQKEIEDIYVKPYVSGEKKREKDEDDDDDDESGNKDDDNKSESNDSEKDLMNRKMQELLEQMTLLQNKIDKKEEEERTLDRFA